MGVLENHFTNSSSGIRIWGCEGQCEQKNRNDVPLAKGGQRVVHLIEHVGWGGCEHEIESEKKIKTNGNL